MRTLNRALRVAYGRHRCVEPYPVYRACCGAWLGSSGGVGVVDSGVGAAAAAAAASTLASASTSRSYAKRSGDPFGEPPRLPQRRVVVTGIGLVTPVGVGTAAAWDAIVSGRTGTRALRPEDLPEGQRGAFESLPSRVAATVDREALAASPHHSSLPADSSRRHAPFAQLALVAAAEALADARWAPSTPQERCSTGVCIGAGIGSTADTADAGRLIASGGLRRVSPFFVPRILVNMAAGAVAIAHGLRGPNHAPSTACATGAHAIGDAFRMVQRGDAKVMLAGATEASVDAIGLGGFSRLKALSTAFNGDPSRASRPFDARRDGFVMGEGAGVLVLEELGHALARGAAPYAEVRGYGLSGDAHHITAPHPDGAGAALAMLRALAGAGVPPGAVRYVNAHATGTPVGDEIELAAIRQVFFGDEDDDDDDEEEEGAGRRIRQRRQPQRRRLLVSSTKGATGHLLGAAGAVEAAFTVLALRDRVAPPTANLEDPDPPPRAGGGLLVGAGRAVPFDEAGGGGDGGGGGGGDGDAALCNAFGFGGTNASLLFATPPG